MICEHSPFVEAVWRTASQTELKLYLILYLQLTTVLKLSTDQWRRVAVAWLCL
jgi:hypothetical protein